MARKTVGKTSTTATTPKDSEITLNYIRCGNIGVSTVHEVVDISGFNEKEMRGKVSALFHSIRNTPATAENPNTVPLDVPICNPNDMTEIAIKTKTEIGQVFMNGFREFFRTIGIDSLNMKDRKGNPITDIAQLKGGKQKEKAQRIAKQYIDFIKRPDLKRYAIQISDIFEVPHYTEKDDRRGKNGFYREHIAPMLILFLLNSGRDVIFTTVTKLSRIVGLVTMHYREITFDDALRIDSRFNAAMLHQFYFRCHPELRSIIFTILDSLQNDHKALNYYRNYCILTKDGTRHTSSKNEEIIITRTERKVLEEFGAKHMMSIFRMDKAEEFYWRVCELINEKHGLDWSRY